MTRHWRSRLHLYQVGINLQWCECGLKKSPYHTFLYEEVSRSITADQYTWRHQAGKKCPGGENLCLVAAECWRWWGYCFLSGLLQTGAAWSSYFSCYSSEFYVGSVRAFILLIEQGRSTKWLTYYRHRENIGTIDPDWNLKTLPVSRSVQPSVCCMTGGW